MAYFKSLVFSCLCALAKKQIDFVADYISLTLIAIFVSLNGNLLQTFKSNSLLTSTLTLSKQEEREVVSFISLLVRTQLCFPSVAREKEWPCKFSRHLFCLTSVSDLAASLEESKDELQVAKRKNTALIKVSVSSKPSALFFIHSSKGGTRQGGLFNSWQKKVWNYICLIGCLTA